METRKITIIEEKAVGMLDSMVREKLIKMAIMPHSRSVKTSPQNGGSKKSKKEDRVFGSMPGLVIHISDDFDEPLEDFAEYM